MQVVETVEQRTAAAKRPNVLRTILMFLSIVGPGMITANIDNDAGGIATYSLAGANFGFAFLWLIVVITLVVMLLLYLTNQFTTVAEFAGIAASADVLHWSRLVAVTIAAIFVALLVLRGNYKVVEKVFLGACLVYLTYIVSGLLAKPDWPVVLRATLAPHISFSPAYLAMFIAVIGTTIAPWMQFYVQSSVVEKGVKPKELRYSQIDVVLGSFVTDIVAFFIIMACGATLFVHHVVVNDAGQAAAALEPLAGKYASLLFAIGLLNASLFAASVLPLSTAYTICEAFGFESGVDKRFGEAPIFYGLYLAIIALGALPVLLPNAPLLPMIFASQVISGMLLPVVIIAMLVLINDRSLMGKNVNGPAFNVVAWVTAVVLITATLAYLFILFRQAAS